MSVRLDSVRRGDRIDDGRRALRYSWASVGLIPFSFVAAMVLGDWLVTVQGYQSGSEELLPLSVVALAGIPAMLVLIAPAISAVLFSIKAVRMGTRNGRVPGVIGATFGVGAVLLNLLPFVLGRLL